MSKASNRVKIDGFRMHQAILDEFRLMKEQSFNRPPASAYIVYFTMLKQVYIENNPKGVMTEYNLSHWARQLDIPYSTLYGGKRYLEEHHFVKEEIRNGMPVLVLRDVEKYNTPERGDVQMNYLLIPHALFETNILAEFARTSNPEAIELLLSLLNQFRTAMSKRREIDLDKLKQARLMSSLKKLLNKKAKDVRRVLAVLESIFEIKFSGLQVRGHQVWISKVEFRLKPECVCENTDEFQVNPLLAKFSNELSHFLDNNGFKYKVRDKRDIMISFKQEVVNRFQFLTSEDEESYTYRDKFLRKFFIDSLNNVVEHIEKVNTYSVFKIKTSIGALFRTAFRSHLKTAISEIPYSLLHDAKVREYKATGAIPKLADL